VLRDLIPMAAWVMIFEGRIVRRALDTEEVLGSASEQVPGRSGLPLLVPDWNREVARKPTPRPTPPV
jgi:hypothetical protein